MSQELSEKKRLLLDYKEKLLKSIKSCEQEIEDVKRIKLRKSTLVDSDSDSDEDIYAKYKQRLCPDTSQLRSDYEQLRICLHATEELTELHILESVVNILVEPPGFAKLIEDLEEGVWREVCAECRVGLVCFSITFFTHQPNRKFAAASYHNLQVNIAKPLHEKELSNSILEDAVRPSDAVQIINAYAKAAKSRKQTLSAIAEKYTEGEVYMKFSPDGGCLLKCHDVMELTWHLQNVRSPVAPFYHKMCFNLDYLGPEYMKVLNHAYKNIHDPNLSTERRTNLLLKIIDICLEAKTQGSDKSSETPQAVKDRRVTLECEMNEQEILADRNKKRNEDTMAMAPPKSLPKKAKAKTPQKRPGDELNDVRRKKIKHSFKERSEQYFKLTDKNNEIQEREKLSKNHKNDNDEISKKTVDINKKAQDPNIQKEIKNSKPKSNIEVNNKKIEHNTHNKNTEKETTSQLKNIDKNNTNKNDVDLNKKKLKKNSDNKIINKEITSQMKNNDKTNKLNKISDNKINNKEITSQTKNNDKIYKINSNDDVNKKKLQKIVDKETNSQNKIVKIDNVTKKKASENIDKVVSTQKNLKLKAQETTNNQNEQIKKPKISNDPKTQKITKNIDIQAKSKLLQNNRAKGSDVNNIKNKEKFKMLTNLENNKKSKNIIKTKKVLPIEKNTNKNQTITLQEKSEKNIQKTKEIKTIGPILKEKNSHKNINKEINQNGDSKLINKAEINEKISKIPLMKGVHNKKNIGNFKSSPRVSSSKAITNTINNQIFTTPLRKSTLIHKTSFTSKLKQIFSMQKKIK